MNTSPQKPRVNDDDKTSKPSSSLSQPSTSSSPWLGLKDPRIVRVSRAFGGKDRHSKVRTVRGLRDRRVRLSVPTAIQLYDLQDRLGLNQPSKVVDWLLNAAKDDVDELPPLQIPPSGFEPDRPLHGTRSDEEMKIREGDDNCARPSFWSQESSESNKFSHTKPISNTSESSLLPHQHYMSSLCQWVPDSGHGFESLPASTLSLSSGPRANYFPAATSSSQFNQFQMLMMCSSSASSSQSLLPSSRLYQSTRPFDFSVSSPRNNDEGENEEKVRFRER